MSTIHMINDLGDINEDMIIDILDIVELSLIIVDNYSTFTSYQYWASDINLDSNINVLDIVEIINIILNI